MNSKQPIVSVSQVNQYIKNMFIREYALSVIFVKGEVSNCKYHSSGHIYFTLKDKTSQITCVMFAGQRGGLSFRMEDGQEVIIGGNISVYERDGKYQLYAKQIELAGDGQLYEKFEALKKKLEAQGLFDDSWKKKIPVHATKVGVVTASTGAAIQDIRNIAKRRNPYIQLILYPAVVQGADAAPTIVNGIRTLDRMGLDIIIVGRGGGSIEDLWAFNEESVAWAIFECETPVISAVGHETDITIADFVADMRAPTPSAAAELAIFDVNNVAAALYDMQDRLIRRMSDRITAEREKVFQMRARLSLLSPQNQILQKRQFLLDSEERLQMQMSHLLLQSKTRFEAMAGKLDALSPLHKLKVGFAYIENTEGKKINSVENVEAGNNIVVTLHDGVLHAKVENVNRKDTMEWLNR